MGVTGASHGDGATLVFQAVVGFVENGWQSGFLPQGIGKPAALRHKAGNNPMENRALVVTAVHIADKIGHGDGCASGVELNHNIAESGVQGDSCFLRGWGRARVYRRGGRGLLQGQKRAEQKGDGQDELLQSVVHSDSLH